MLAKVRMFTLSTCIHCKATKKLLNACGVQYEFTDVDLLPEDERYAILEDVMGSLGNWGQPLNGNKNGVSP